MIISINNRAFDKESLLEDHIFQGKMMMLRVRSIFAFQKGFDSMIGQKSGSSELVFSTEFLKM